jgi:hypothetical protein
MREYRMSFRRMNPGEQAIDPEQLGLRSKRGGKPDWEPAMIFQ